MSDRNTGQSYRFHPPICICQSIQLHLHLAGLRAVEYALVEELFDILFHKEGQLQGESYASVIQSRQPLGQQLAVFRDLRSTARIGADGNAWYDFRTPFCP